MTATTEIQATSGTHDSVPNKTQSLGAGDSEIDTETLSNEIAWRTYMDLLPTSKGGHGKTDWYTMSNNKGRKNTKINIHTGKNNNNKERNLGTYL